MDWVDVINEDAEILFLEFFFYIYKNIRYFFLYIHILYYVWGTIRRATD